MLNSVCTCFAPVVFSASFSSAAWLVQNEPERAELILLPFAVALAKFTALAVEYGAGKQVAALAAIELDQDPAPVGFVVDEPQHVE